MKYIIPVLSIVLIAGLSRLIPHPWNFTAIGAMALFSGAMMPQRFWAFLAPVLSLLWTDAVLGFHSSMVYVYAAVFLVTIIGFYVQDSKAKILGGALAGSVLFFLITNLGVWFSGGMYPLNTEGLLQCFAMAIPFFGNQIAGDLFYTGVLFGAYALIKTYAPAIVSSNSRSSI